MDTTKDEEIKEYRNKWLRSGATPLEAEDMVDFRYFGIKKEVPMLPLPYHINNYLHFKDNVKEVINNYTMSFICDEWEREDLEKPLDPRWKQMAEFIRQGFKRFLMILDTFMQDPLNDTYKDDLLFLMQNIPYASKVMGEKAFNSVRLHYMHNLKDDDDKLAFEMLNPDIAKHYKHDLTEMKREVKKHTGEDYDTFHENMKRTREANLKVAYKELKEIDKETNKQMRAREEEDIKLGLKKPKGRKKSS